MLRRSKNAQPAGTAAYGVGSRRLPGAPCLPGRSGTTVAAARWPSLLPGSDWTSIPCRGHSFHYRRVAPTWLRARLGTAVPT